MLCVMRRKTRTFLKIFINLTRPHAALSVNSDPARYDDIAQSIVQDAENSGSKEPSQSIEIDSELGDLSPIDTDADQSGKVLDLLSTTPLLIDDLIRASELPANSISSILIELELAGRVERHPGNRVSRIAK